MENHKAEDYPFNDSLFIGIIKFYDTDKNFGYISSNNWRMESNKRFRNREQSFYINQSSLDSPIEEKKLVVFQPVFINGKLQATNVRLVDLTIDHDIVMDYYSHDNIITFEDKVKTFSQKPYGRPNFEGYEKVRRTYYISSKAGISRYQLIWNYISRFKNDNDFNNLCHNIDILINSIGGERAYNKQIRGTYSNKEKEHEALFSLFAILNDKQIQVLVSQHQSVQMFAPDKIMLLNIDTLDFSWGVSRKIERIVSQKEVEHKVELIIKIIDNGLEGLSLGEVKRIQNEFSRRLDAYRNNVLRSKIDELLLINCKSDINSLNTNDVRLFLNCIKVITEEYVELSKEGRITFVQDLLGSYITAITNILKHTASDSWNSNERNMLFSFIKNNKILKSYPSGDVMSIVKQIVRDDFKTFYIETDLRGRTSSDFYEYRNLIKDLYKEEYESLINDIQSEILSKAPFFNIVKWFDSLNKQLPDLIKSIFLELDIKDVIDNITILGKFNDTDGTFLAQVFDKIMLCKEYIFYDAETSSYPRFPQNIALAENIISIYGKKISCKQFMRLKCKDRIILHFELYLDLVTPEELKEYLLSDTKGFCIKIHLDTKCGEQAIASILRELDCTTVDGINSSISWLNTYVGPRDTESYLQNFKIQSILKLLSTSTNEHLKVLLWAMYFMSSGKIDLLKDIYCLLPADLQIRVLKKLFNLMALGKIDSSLDWLETNLGVNKHNLSLPIMIVLRFLRLKMENPDAYMKDTIMLELFAQQADQSKWYMVNKFLTPCNGRIYRPYVGPESIDDSQFTFSGYIEKTICEVQNVYSFVLTKKVVTKQKEETQYDNKLFDRIQDYISINFSKDQYKSCDYNGNRIYYFKDSVAHDVRLMAESYQIMMPDIDYKHTYKQLSDSEKFCCECRLSDKLDNSTNRLFLWCSNHSCFSKPAHFHSSYEWEDYTVLDFMRILNISTDYTSKIGKTTRFGQYMIFSSYMQSFHELYEHLKCRGCGKLMEPCDISNFSRSTVTDFHCVQSDCDCKDIVYLNHCFNQKCNHIIDSRDSKQCPNGGYICEKCGSCCSQEKFKERLDRLNKTGGHISKRLLDLIASGSGHWEEGVKFCYKCGKKLQDDSCSDCHISYSKK